MLQGFFYAPEKFFLSLNIKIIGDPIMTNANLRRAEIERNDEFYTPYDEIAKEMKLFTDLFKNKIIYLNCDNPKYSNFWKYFRDNFAKLKLKELIASYYDPAGGAPIS